MRRRDGKVITTALALLATSLLGGLACGGRNDSCGTPTCTIQVDLEPALRGFVRDAVTQAPIEGAIVTLGDKSASTDANGWYFLENLSVGIFNVRVTREGYVAVQRAVRVNDTAFNQADFFLQPEP